MSRMGQFAQVVAKHQAGVRGIVHAHHFPLVVVLIIHQDSILAFEVEGSASSHDIVMPMLKAAYLGL